MSEKYDLLLKNVTVVDPLNRREEIADLAVADGRVARLAADISPAQASQHFYLPGLCAVPGLVDLHTHASAWLGGRFGHKMLARAGVTTALDMSGPIDSVLDIARDYGTGLNIACINYVRPGHTVKNDDPSAAELADLLSVSLSKGAIGLKLLGGHYPLTPGATARAIEVVNQQKAYVAFHAGTKQTASNIDGFLEAVALADGRSLHLAHINSYCRGLVHPYMEETETAVSALTANPNIISEAYLSPINGTSAKCSQGEPESLVTRRCLITGGFTPDEKGLEEAILAGWAQINMEVGGEVVLATGTAAVEYWRGKGTDTTVGFAVNPPEPRLRLATAKRPDGSFVVNCISTDGGGIPRNVIAAMGLALVKMQAISLGEFVMKASSNPARILGLKNKGHLAEGADADITVLDTACQEPVMTIAAGKIVMYKGHVCGQGGTRIITSEAGEAYVRGKGLDPIVVNMAESAFYQRR